MDLLRIEDQDFLPDLNKVIEYTARTKLKTLDSDRPLIIVFGEFALVACIWVKFYNSPGVSIILRSPVPPKSHLRGKVPSNEDNHRSAIERLQT